MWHIKTVDRTAPTEDHAMISHTYTNPANNVSVEIFQMEPGTTAIVTQYDLNAGKTIERKEFDGRGAYLRAAKYFDACAAFHADANKPSAHVTAIMRHIDDATINGENYDQITYAVVYAGTEAAVTVFTDTGSVIDVFVQRFSEGEPEEKVCQTIENRIRSDHA